MTIDPFEANQGPVEVLAASSIWIDERRSFVDTGPGVDAALFPLIWMM
jgi:hypothetical protein